MAIASTILGVVALVVALISLALMILIARRQSCQLDGHSRILQNQRELIEANQRLIEDLDQKVLGTLPSVGEVYKCIAQLLEDAGEDNVYFMCYWLWFGADLSYPMSITSKEIADDTSEVTRLLWDRATNQRPTLVVTYDPTLARGQLQRFIKAVLTYNRSRAMEQADAPSYPDLTDADCEDVLDRYRDSYKKYEDHCRFRAVDPPLGKSEIANIMFVREGRDQAAVLFLLETDALEERVSGGGFVSREKTMVTIIKEQIVAAAGRDAR